MTEKLLSNSMPPGYAIKIFALVMLLSIGSRTRASNAVPEWAIPYLDAPEIEFEGSERGVSMRLFKGSIVEFAEDGSTKTILRTITRIRMSRGISSSTYGWEYMPEWENIESATRWIVSEDGKTEKTGLKEMQRLENKKSSYVSESGMHTFRFHTDDNVDIGSIIIDEVTIASAPDGQRNSFRLEHFIPVWKMHVDIKIPEGFELKYKFFNTSEQEPEVSDNVYSWKFENIPNKLREKNYPGGYYYENWFEVRLVRPGDHLPPSLCYGQSWNELAASVSEFYKENVDVQLEISSKAHQLAADQDSIYSKIVAISDYCQQISPVRYNVVTGWWSGLYPPDLKRALINGTTDHSSRTLLLCEMLNAIGVPACPVAAAAFNAWSFDPDWVSVAQFTHIIVAIRKLPSLDNIPSFNVPGMGECILFDPNDSRAVFGNPDRKFYGTNALSIIPEGNLFKLPEGDPEDVDYLKVKVQSEISESGIHSAELQMNARGSRRIRQSSMVLGKDPDEARASYIKSMLQPDKSRVSLGVVDFMEQSPIDPFQCRVEYSCPSDLQPLSGGLFLINPAFIEQSNTISEFDKARECPYELQQHYFEETLEMFLPGILEIVEVPNPIDVTTDFGRYTSETAVSADRIIHKRALRINRIIVQPKEFDALQDFRRKILTGDGAAILLKIK